MVRDLGCLGGCGGNGASEKKRREREENRLPCHGPLFSFFFCPFLFLPGAQGGGRVCFFGDVCGMVPHSADARVGEGREGGGGMGEGEIRPD